MPKKQVLNEDDDADDKYVAPVVGSLDTAADDRVRLVDVEEDNNKTDEEKKKTGKKKKPSDGTHLVRISAADARVVRDQIDAPTHLRRHGNGAALTRDELRVEICKRLGVLVLLMHTCVTLALNAVDNVFVSFLPISVSDFCALTFGGFCFWFCFFGFVFCCVQQRMQRIRRLN